LLPECRFTKRGTAAGLPCRWSSMRARAPTRKRPMLH